MVKAPRKKLVVALVVSVAVVIAASAIQPVRNAISFIFLSPSERKVVGEWQTHMIGGLNVTTIHADGTWSSAGGSCFGDDEPPIVGHWRLDGSEVVFSYDSRQFGDLPVPSPRRSSIQQLVETDQQTRLALRDQQK